MIKIPVSISMAGFTYDPDQPTLQTERLSYAQLQVLDALSVGGYEFRQVEASDIIALDSSVKAYVDSVRSQSQGAASIEYSLVSSGDELLVPGALGGVVVGRVIAAMKSEDKEQPVVSGADLTAISNTLAAIQGLLEFISNQEQVLNIGSHVVWTKSMAVDEL